MRNQTYSVVQQYLQQLAPIEWWRTLPYWQKDQYRRDYNTVQRNLNVLSQNPYMLKGDNGQLMSKIHAEISKERILEAHRTNGHPIDTSTFHLSTPVITHPDPNRPSDWWDNLTPFQQLSYRHDIRGIRRNLNLIVVNGRERTPQGQFLSRVYADVSKVVANEEFDGAICVAVGTMANELGRNLERIITIFSSIASPELASYIHKAWEEHASHFKDIWGRVSMFVNYDVEDRDQEALARGVRMIRGLEASFRVLVTDVVESFYVKGPDTDWLIEETVKDVEKMAGKLESLGKEELKILVRESEDKLLLDAVAHHEEMDLTV